MAKYIGPKCKLSRREGVDLELKSSLRPLDSKCKLDQVPGQHGARRTRLSDYALQLREKQKVRRIYGILERQFRKYFKMAAKKTGITGENLLQILEIRLDNVVYRMGFAPSRNAARQIIRHGHIIVNDRKVNIPSFSVKADDEIIIKQGSRQMNLIQESMEAATEVDSHEWFKVEKDNFSGKILTLPKRDQIPLDVDERLIVEYYSK